HRQRGTRNSRKRTVSRARPAACRFASVIRQRRYSLRYNIVGASKQKVGGIPRDTKNLTRQRILRAWGSSVPGTRAIQRGKISCGGRKNAELRGLWIESPFEPVGVYVCITARGSCLGCPNAPNMWPDDSAGGVHPDGAVAGSRLTAVCPTPPVGGRALWIDVAGSVSSGAYK